MARDDRSVSPPRRDHDGGRDRSSYDRPPHAGPSGREPPRRDRDFDRRDRDYDSRPRERDYDSRDRDRDADRRGGPGSRQQPPPPPPSSSRYEREREGGTGSRGDGGYSVKDREKERESDRKRYDVDVKGEPGTETDVAVVEPEKPNFGNSGLLAKETNTVKGVQLKYNEPPEARKPIKKWRLYVFKGDEQIDLIHIFQQSAYLVGRDTVVTDIPIAHPSCSKQHAAIQFRQITTRNEFGESSTEVKPFVIDLDSTNGTSVNGSEVPKSRYYELRNKDVIKFGTSSREYVLLHEEAGA